MRSLYGVLSIVILACISQVVFGAYPATKYAPGDTTDPGCSPGDINCEVELATATNIWSQTGSTAYYNEGNVGIGTSTPTQSLDIIGNIGATKFLASDGSSSFPSIAFRYDNGVNTGLYLPDQNNIGISTNGTERVRITDIGNVGIGTTVPTTKLEVQGQQTITTTSDRKIIFNDSGTENWSFSINDGVSSHFGLYNDTDSAYRMVWDEDGNVGIGTTSPTSKLDIVGNTHINGSLNIGGSDDTDYHHVDIKRQISGSTEYLTSYVDLITGGQGGIVSSKGIFFQGDHNENPRYDMVIAENGNVGMGTDIPAWDLEIQDRGADNAVLAIDSATGLESQLVFLEQDVRQTKIGYNPVQDSLIFHNYVNGTTNMVIKDTGNVGIGTTSPEARLHINSTSDLTLSSTTHGITIGNITGINVGIDNNEIMARNNGTSSPLYLQNEAIGGHTIMNRADGNVGIGTTSPTQKLEVNGTALATAWNTTSDKRLKKNIVLIDSPIKKIQGLRGVYFDWKSDNSHDVGVIAQEVEAVFPEIVTTDAEGIKSVDYAKLTPVLLEAIKELEARVAELEAQ